MMLKNYIIVPVTYLELDKAGKAEEKTRGKK